MGNRTLQDAISAKEKGLAHYRRGEIETARQAFEEAKALFAAVGDSRGQGEMLNNLGTIHLQAGRWAEAESALLEAATIFSASGDTGHRGQALGNLGEFYRRQGKAEDAVASLKEAAEIFRQVGDQDKEASTWQLISRLRLGQGRWLEAMHFYDLALSAKKNPSLGRRLLQRLVRLPASLMTRGG